MGMQAIRGGAGLALAAMVFAGGCGGISGGAERQIEQAQQAINAGRYQRAEELLNPVFRAHGGKSDAAVAYYLRGQCRIQTGARDDAQQDLRTALRLAKEPALAAQVEAQLGNLAFDSEAYAAASAHYARAVDRLPRMTPTDRVLYQYGVSLQRTGRFDEARGVYGRLLKDFPNSPHVDAARRKQAWRDPHFSIQCGAFAQPASARDLVAKLRARGLDATLVPEVQGGSRRHVVRVGRFPTYADAARRLGQARSVASDAYIVP